MEAGQFLDSQQTPVQYRKGTGQFSFVVQDHTEQSTGPSLLSPSGEEGSGPDCSGCEQEACSPLDIVQLGMF